MERGSRVSSASVSSQGFEVVRGRGYRPLQVIAYVEALSDDRDAAWERAARLTVLAREMEEELELLRVRVAGLAPQTYESLGESARRLFGLAGEEAAAVRESARQYARDVTDLAEDDAAGVREAARTHAETVRAGADERAGEVLL
ncbi:cellulose-binding protein, partial [Streptomyces sp. 13-12-16]